MGEVLTFPRFVAHTDPNGWECGSNVRIPGGFTGVVKQIDNTRPDSIQVRLNATGAIGWHRPCDLTAYKPFLIDRDCKTSLTPPEAIPAFLREGPDDGDAA